MRIKVGIDGRFLTHSQKGGYKSYVEGLVYGLMTLEDDNEYVLYLGSGNYGDFWANYEDLWVNSNRRIRRVTRWRLPAIEMVLREQVILPWIAHRDKVDLLHYPCNTGNIRPTVPYVLTLHDVQALANPYVRFTRPWIKSMWSYAIQAYEKVVIPRVARRATMLITVSEYEKTMISERLGLPLEKIAVTHLAPSPIFRALDGRKLVEARYRVRDRYGIEGGYILSVGSKPSKNIAGVIDAYHLLVKNWDLDHLLVLVVPHQQYKGELVARVAKLPIRSKVIFIDAVPQMHLVDLYAAASVFVFPSFREGFGLPPLEAMACGTPVVTSITSSLPEVVGDAAMLVNPHNPEEIAVAIRQVLTYPELRATLVRRGLCRAAMFSWEVTAQRTVSVYESCFWQHRKLRGTS